MLICILELVERMLMWISWKVDLAQGWVDGELSRRYRSTSVEHDPYKNQPEGDA